METAAGIYTRIIFPDALSKVSPHLSDLQKAMLDATPEEVHPLGMEALREAASGRNGRFPGKSISPEGVLYWDNLLTPLIDASGEVLSILCVSRDVTEKVLLEKQLEEAIAREKLLSREMHHRIKNLFSVVSGLIAIAKKEAGTAATSETMTTIIREKLGALSRASDAVFVQNSHEFDSTATADLEAVVRSVLEPYGSRCSFIGQAVSIRADTMTTFALFLHELATNSVKYGALSADDGSITVRWTRHGETLALVWVETGGPDILVSPERQGFGSEMVDRIVQSVGGTIVRTWRTGGLFVELDLPAIASS